MNLTQICKNPWVNIVNLAFVTAYKGPLGLPTINLGSACKLNISQQVQPDMDVRMAACHKTAAAIQICQKNSKKVLLSIGGEIGKAKIDFNSTKDAIDAAGYLWNLFGGGSSLDFKLRPFGNVKLDGFDIGKFSFCVHFAQV